MKLIPLFISMSLLLAACNSGSKGGNEAPASQKNPQTTDDRETPQVTIEDDESHQFPSSKEAQEYLDKLKDWMHMGSIKIKTASPNNKTHQIEVCGHTTTSEHVGKTLREIRSALFMRYMVHRGYAKEKPMIEIADASNQPKLIYVSELYYLTDFIIKSDLAKWDERGVLCDQKVYTYKRKTEDLKDLESLRFLKALNDREGSEYYWKKRIDINALNTHKSGSTSIFKACMTSLDNSIEMTNNMNRKAVTKIISALEGEYPQIKSLNANSTLKAEVPTISINRSHPDIPNRDREVFYIHDLYKLLKESIKLIPKNNEICDEKLKVVLDRECYASECEYTVRND